jgi:mono/diheme cytochrome c family protein
MNRLVRLFGLIVVLGAGAAWLLTRPDPLPAAALAGLTPDAGAGRLVFAASGCASCHTAKDAVETDAPVLSGGRRFASPFGTFIAPNISPDPTYGIGGWSDLEIINATMRGVGRHGEHLFPAMPYDAYGKAELGDMVNLVAYLRTLPADATPNAPHEVGFPFNIRRTLGGWKRLFVSHDWVMAGDLTPAQTRGRYIAEALGHCGECHTPRNALGGLQRGLWLSGAANPSGTGRIPNITPGKLQWSEAEIVEYLTSGFTPDFDTAGGEMVEVIRNTAQLPAADRAAIAAYLKVVPAIVPAE